MPSKMSVVIATPTRLTAFALGKMLTRASRLISDLDFKLINATSTDSFQPKLGAGGSYGSNYRINFRAGI